jgi:hypothetical protein
VKLTTRFDPIAPGEKDDFAFDFTADMGSAELTSATWTISVSPQRKDHNPQSRLIDSRVATRMYLRSSEDGSLTLRDGFFAIATLGNIPASAVGGTYMLSALATVTDPDGGVRLLNLSVDLPCQAR